jgi:uncharacterized damage-inducible protein DinB
VDEYRRQINKRIDTLLDRVHSLDEATLRKKPSPEEWSVQEVLCHVAEANSFWLNELRRVVRSPGPWGRGMDHEGRLAAVDHRKPDEVITEIKEGKKLVDAVLSELREEDLDVEAPHRNPKFGNRPVSFLLDHFMVEHIDRHIKQIDRILERISQ